MNALLKTSFTLVFCSLFTSGLMEGVRKVNRQVFKTPQRSNKENSSKQS